MNFPAHWFSAPILLAANLLCLLLFAAALRPALPALRQHGRAALAGLMLAALCWSLRAAPAGGLLEGISYHLLGVCLLSLMAGIPAAFCLLSLLMLPYVWLWQGAENLPVAGLQVLAGIVPPLLCAALARHLVRKLPRNLFVYIFVNGFFAAAAGVLLSGAAAGLLLYGAGVFPLPILQGSVLPVFFLIAWGEAFLTGLLTAIFIALAPQLITTFSDADYLRPKPRQIWK
ncbi:hypothetical protein H9Q10_02850 [Eikenella sp. S3360]|uniref:Energy-coupling factor ABC transporter permease n=2 Tax=Eikenella glucosivorans TaxID=2766967 RepID=A0ABS0N8K4_9NEIS|nr:hypothetical protein [Eikenella glucosivorans]